MVDSLTPAQRSAQMARVRGKDTRVELMVRKLLTSEGYRYRKHMKDLPGRPDLVFTRRRKVVFVHGCFWHGHDCANGRVPKSRTDFWMAKFARNRERDLNQQAALGAAGWEVVVVWECELKDHKLLVERLRSFLGPPCWPKKRMIRAEGGSVSV